MSISQQRRLVYTVYDIHEKDGNDQQQSLAPSTEHAVLTDPLLFEYPCLCVVLLLKGVVFLFDQSRKRADRVLYNVFNKVEKR